MNAASALAAIREAGFSVVIHADGLRLGGSSKMPGATVIQLAREFKIGIERLLRDEQALQDANDAFEERAAIAEYEGGLPRAVAEGIARLETLPALKRFSEKRRQAIIDGTAKFADVWAAKALKLGWSVEELFGLHPSAPEARLDACGLAFLLDSGEVIAMDEKTAVIRSFTGIITRYYRGDCKRTGAQLAWDIGLRRVPDAVGGKQ
jgi:hypothetical protein